MRLLYLPLALIWFGLTSHPVFADQPAAKKWNVLFLFSDDQRADTIAAHGNKHIQTPNLDRLASTGTSFMRAYCMGSQQPAVCVPSRAMLLTGRSLFRVNVKLENQTTWPEMFARAGYVTFVTGKWHNGQPSVLRCFMQGQAVFMGGMGNPFQLPIADLGGDKLIGARKTTQHSVAQFADCAIEFIKQQKPERPFLAYVPFNLPHDPRVAPPKYHEPYNASKPPMPANFLPTHPFNNGEMAIRDELLAPWPRTPEIVRQHLADYYAAITFMDAQIGRILEALKEAGLYDNTIIVFASDSGLAVGSHGLFGKQNLYDHSMRVPMIIAGPGIPKDRRHHAFVYLYDLFPTLGAMTGVPAPDGSEGLNLAPLWQGKAEKVRDSIFLAYMKVQRAVRDERWKLMVYPHVNKTQLFDLQADPQELKDLAGEPARAAEVQRLTRLLQDWQSKLGDTQPLTTAKPLPLEFDFSRVKTKKK